MNFRRAWFLVLAATLTGTLSLAVSPVIGVASALGMFVLNGSVVDGNANIFDGSEIKTTRARGEVYIRNGPTVLLSVNSSAIFYRDRLALEQGSTRVDHLYHYGVQMGRWDLQGDTPESRTLVRRKGDLVQVTALNSTLRVLDERGALATRIETGSALQLNVAGQSVMVPDQSGASPIPKHPAPPKKQLTDYLSLGASVAGTGIAADAILQRHPTSP